MSICPIIPQLGPRQPRPEYASADDRIIETEYEAKQAQSRAVTDRRLHCVTQINHIKSITTYLK